MVRQVGGTIKCHISKNIGHEVPQLVYFYPEVYKSKQWEDKTIVYYTGNSKTQWSPSGFVNGGGLGGSETAVVNLTTRWQKAGYKPVVYGNCVEGTYDGVEYIHCDKFNSNDRFNILILWRGFSLNMLPHVRANKLLVDLHDMPGPHYQPILDNFDKIDRVLVRSRFHGLLFPPETHHKLYAIQNGTPDIYFDQDLSKIEKKRTKLIYTSSYDRGLLEMLKWGWPLIKVKVPDAELHIYYGFARWRVQKEIITIP
jgi:hypothetical protein